MERPLRPYKPTSELEFKKTVAMKKSIIISIALIVLGFVFECLYLGTDATFFSVKFWILGVISIIAGTLGLLLSLLGKNEDDS